MFLSNNSDNSYMDIYERIKSLCKKDGVSVKAMLESEGVNYSSYYSSQQAKRYPNLADLLAISRHFKVSLDYLVTGEDSSRAEQELKLLKAKLIDLATS